MGNIAGGKKRKNGNFTGGAFNESDIQTIIHIIDTQLIKHNLIPESQTAIVSSPSSIVSQTAIASSPSSIVSPSAITIKSPIIEATNPRFSIDIHDLVEILANILKTDNLYIYVIILKSIKIEHFESLMKILIDALGPINLDNEKELLDYVKPVFIDFINRHCMDFISMDPNYKHGRVPELPVNDKKSPLGTGATSVVNIGTCGNSNTYYYAIKNKCSDSILLELDHPFIVKLFSFNKIKKICILEYCIYIDISNVTNICAKQLFVQLIFALAYLESNYIIHGDLHDKNIMVGRDGFLRIIDFDKSYTYLEFKEQDPSVCYYEDRLSLICKINYNKYDYTNDCFHPLFKEDKNHKYMASFLGLIGSFVDRRPNFTFEELKNSDYIKYDHNDSTEYWDMLIQKERVYYTI